VSLKYGINESPEEIYGQNEIYSREDGIKAIIALQAYVDIVESVDEATTGWDDMDEHAKKSTTDAHKAVCGGFPDTIITIPCDYRHEQGEACKKGNVLIYGEMGGRPPETIVCPKCKGLGTIEVPKSEIMIEISDRQDEILWIKDEIIRLEKLLK